MANRNRLNWYRECATVWGNEAIAYVTDFSDPRRAYKAAAYAATNYFNYVSELEGSDREPLSADRGIEAYRNR